MLPSWFTKLRDVKAGSKYRQPHPSPSLSLKKRDEHPASFAKSLSLQRASSKARNARFEGGIANACSDKDDSCPFISNESTQNVCNLQSSELGKDAADPHPCACLDPWDGDGVSMSTCKSTFLPPGKETKAPVQKGHGVSDNDTEDFALTSETRSSFCSETSSADSSMTCKYGCEEEGHQDEQVWREGDNFEAFKSPDIVCINYQKACGEIMPTEEQKGSSHSVEISPSLTSRLCQENAHIRWSLMSDTRRGRQSFLYSDLMTSRCSSVSEKGNAGKASLLLKEMKRRRSRMEHFASLIKSNAGKASLDSREAKENCAFLKNLTNIQYNRSHVNNQETPDKSHEKCNANAGVPNADKHRYISGRSENYGLDTFAQNAWQRERDAPHSSAENPSTIAPSVWCTQQKSSEENLDGKRRAISMRRRQRGSSISAVLPPDLQGVVGDSLALVKMSDDPYEDFRQSMHEMIMEKDLEGSMDVEELLYCYLTLNSPEHHELIEEVFSDVWSAILMTLR